MKIKKNTKSILEEIFETTVEIDFNVVEARAEHAFASMFNFLKLIDSLDISKEEMDDLNKRILLCIKNRDTARFDKAIKRLKRSKHES